mgnify:CR=1 FL=1
MALTPLLYSNISLADLVTQVNLALAPYLTHYIRDVQFLSTEGTRNNGNEVGLSVVVEAGAGAIATPYQFTAFESKTPAAAQVLVQAFITANPAAFIAPVMYIDIDSPRRTNRFLAGFIYNTVLANGVANWIPFGASSGLTTNTYVLANGANTTESLVIADVRSVLWKCTLTKAAATYSCVIHAQNDGGVVNVSHVEVDVSVLGVVDVVFTVTNDGVNMNLIATTGSAGWTLIVTELAAHP